MAAVVNAISEAEWSVLEGEWVNVVTGQRNAFRRQVSVWETDFERLAKDQRTLEDAGLWVGGPDDVLSIIRKQRRETYYSAILARPLIPLAAMD